MWVSVVLVPHRACEDEHGALSNSGGICFLRIKSMWLQMHSVYAMSIIVLSITSVAAAVISMLLRGADSVVVPSNHITVDICCTATCEEMNVLMS